MKPLKMAHPDGHTEVCYDSSGSFILTSGSDGKICIWEGRDDTDTTTVNIGDRIFALAFQGGRFFAATDENTIRIHTFPDGVGDGMVTRFTAPCRHFCLCDDGSILIAGADDFKIKVISMEESECICLYSEHQAPILSVSVDPTKEFIASSSCDGTVKIWNIIDGATEKSLNILTKCSDSSQAKSLCRMCWSTDGEFLLIPVSNEVHIYLRSSWEVVRKLSHSDITDVINVMVMCSDGKHIAVGCTNGDIGIFEWQNNKLIAKHSHPKHLLITSMAWNPIKGGELALCDNSGQLGFLDVIIGDKRENNMSVTTKNGGSVFDDMDDDMLVTTTGRSPTKDNNGDDIDKFFEDDENSIDIGSIKRSLNLDNDDTTDSIGPSKDGEESKTVTAPAPVIALPANIFKPTPPQPPFQPGSTPEHLSSRFMVWNSVGTVRQYVSEDENSIDIEFHDTSTHHALHIDNKSDYIMAALSKQAVLLASREDDDNPSKLLCMHFGSWDSQKEWSYTMPEGEDIRAITLTETWVAVATESRNIRIFSIGGLQRQIFSLPGCVVALAAHGNQLLALYHKGMGLPGDQHMGVFVMQVQGSSKKVLVNGDSLPLTPGSKLSWIGIYLNSFSEEGGIFSMDLDGIVRMLNPYFGSTWCPVANTKKHVKGKSDHYWMVGVSERLQQIRCIPCKGSRYPATLPRPALVVLPFLVPLCDPDSEKSQYEESYQRSFILTKHLMDSGIEDDELDKRMRENLIKLFAFATKSNRDFRALEVCDMMEDISLLHLAATYATRLKRLQLAERVSEVMQSRQDEINQGTNGQVEREMEDEDEENKDTRKYRSIQNDNSNDDVEENDEPEAKGDEDFKTFSSGPLLITNVEKNNKVKEKSNTRSNPFKIARLDSIEKTPKGTQVFDKMEKSTPKTPQIFAPIPVTIKKSTKKPTGNQAKLTAFKKDDKASKDGKSSVKQELLSQTSEDKSENSISNKKVSAFSLWYDDAKSDLMEEHPDLSEEDLSQTATERFRTLTKEEREAWVQKAKSASGDSDGSKKRKLSPEEEQDKTEDRKKLKTELKPLSQSTNSKLAKFSKCD
ncbi:unnamed protein product [Lymnaea stagnalis]|uniref:HMG box domain-containing protein n=1 Tax=Lymnaea stagnalis TaxID=6523 RepID=A0AAV2I2J3_LYMST